MPARSDLDSILILGAGPIVIGQACEFDYSGAQACKALRECGYRVILVNSNPATIMTDPDMADQTYIEPVQWQTVAAIIEKERPSAVLPTMGGQTALNCALDLAREGVLDKYKVELIGATQEAIDKAEDRDKFDKAIKRIGLETPKNAMAHSWGEAQQVQSQLGFPCVIRPSFTMGGSGGGIAYNIEEFEAICKRGLELSPTSELLIDESLVGWKEYEMEVVRDKADNCIIVCAIENLDPMGVHTGDSITVAPAQTLTDKEYQILRDASLAILREIGVETGGSNVQFAIQPDTGRLVVIEMNPRVSRSSALASKATGFPIAKVAAKLAVGFTLDELKNDITGGVTPASFEPAIDYVVTKIPRFNFEKFPKADDTLTTQMKSVGEVMAIGRTFQESFQKALRGLEVGCVGLDPVLDPLKPSFEQELFEGLRRPAPMRVLKIADAFRAGWSLQQVFDVTQVDPWFLDQLLELVEIEAEIMKVIDLKSVNKDTLFYWKQKGFSDARLAQLLSFAAEEPVVNEDEVRLCRQALKVKPVFKRVDSCAGEFASMTPYMYSTFESVCEAAPTDREKVVILGGGPNRIGQGIEFDYCCVQAAFAVKDCGYESIMVNCNPETVSTDYDTSDRLYFEPITFEDVMAIIDLEKPIGVIVQYGGQTPLKLAKRLEAAGVPILGTSPDAIDRAEDRERFQSLVTELSLLQPDNRTITSKEQGVKAAAEIGYPLVVRPSYVLGGRAMELVYSLEGLERYLETAVKASEDNPVLLDRFLNDAIEVDVDAVSDGQSVTIGSIMQHLEEAGVHSGDSACSIPPYSLPEEIQDEIRRQTKQLALALQVKGLMNIQFAVKGSTVYLLEVNPRASRTVPFVSKYIGRSLASIGVKCMLGLSLEEQGFETEIRPSAFAVKEAVFPFNKFPGVDPLLGPEMKSTGEVMGVGKTFEAALAKALTGAGERVPTSGRVFISVKNSDKPGLVEIGPILANQGFTIVATGGTADALSDLNIAAQRVNKVKQGRPHIVDKLKDGQIDFIINTTDEPQAIEDSIEIRCTALQHKVFYITTMAAAKAVCQLFLKEHDQSVCSLQEWNS